MSTIQFERPVKKSRDKTKSLDGQAYDMANFRIRDSSVQMIQETANNLYEYMQRRSNGLPESERSGDPDHSVHWMEYYYQDESFAYLTPKDQEKFLNLIVQFGIRRIKLAPLRDQLIKLYGLSSREHFLIEDAYPSRDSSTKGRFGEWTTVGISLPSIDRSSFYTVGGPTDKDPLALVGSAGFTLTVYRTVDTRTSVNDKTVVLENVTTSLFGSYVRSGRGRADILNESDGITRYDITIHLSSRSERAEGMSFDVSK